MPSSVGSHLFPLRAGWCGVSDGPLYCMSYGAASSSGFCCVTYPTFSGCGFLTFFVFSYVLPYIFLCFLHQFYNGLQVTCSYEAFQHDKARGFLLACSSRRGIDTVVFMAWYLGTSSLPYFSSIDIALRGPVSLVLGILQTLFLTAGLPLCALVRLWLFCTFASHLTLSGTSLANGFLSFFFSDIRPVAFVPVTVPLVGIYVVSLFPSPLPRSFLWYIPPSKSV